MFTDLGQASKKTIGVLAQDKNDVLLVTKSASGRWYCVTDNDTDGVSFGVGASLVRCEQQRRVPARRVAAAGHGPRLVRRS